MLTASTRACALHDDGERCSGGFEPKGQDDGQAPTRLHHTDALTSLVGEDNWMVDAVELADTYTIVKHNEATMIYNPLFCEPAVSSL